MKKLIVGLLMTAMICSLAACGGKNQSSAGTDTSAVGETALLPVYQLRFLSFLEF